MEEEPSILALHPRRFVGTVWHQMGKADPDIARGFLKIVLKSWISHLDKGQCIPNKKIETLLKEWKYEHIKRKKDILRVVGELSEEMEVPLDIENIDKRNYLICRK